MRPPAFTISFSAKELKRIDAEMEAMEISDMFGFSSPAYFSRYVLKNLGVNPTEFRG